MEHITVDIDFTVLEWNDNESDTREVAEYSNFSCEASRGQDFSR